MIKADVINKKQIFFPNLDALRFFCFLSVFLFHSFATKYQNITSNGAYFFVKKILFGNGNLGVNFFFVLSGFLITYLLLIEKTDYKKVHIGNFYIRRILRIWPLFYFCVFFGFLIFPFLKASFGEVPNESANPVFYLLFLNNIDFIHKGLPDCSVLGILWSVAIEEQFYLFWPLIIAVVKPRYLPFTFVSILIVSFIFRIVNAHNPTILENHSLSCISDLTVGGMGAYFAFYSQPFLTYLRKLPKGFTAIIYLGTFILFFLRHQIFDHNVFLLAIDRLVVSLFFLMIILEQNFNERSFFKMQSFKWISKLGQYTYGLYCLHMIGILIVAKSLAILNFNTKVWQVLLVEGLGSLAITILLAYVSYQYFEKKFLLLKKRFTFIRTDSQNLTDKETRLKTEAKDRIKYKMYDTIKS